MCVCVRIHQGLERNSLLNDLIWQLIPSVITAVNLSHLSEELKGGDLSMRVWITLGIQINTSHSAIQAFAPGQQNFHFHSMRGMNGILHFGSSLLPAVYFIFPCLAIYSFFCSYSFLQIIVLMYLHNTFTVSHWADQLLKLKIRRYKYIGFRKKGNAYNSHCLQVIILYMSSVKTMAQW